MHRTLIGLLVWLPTFLAWELPAVFWKRCPWPTFSDTVRGAVGWWHPIAYFVALILFVLWGHFDEHWRVRYLIVVTFALAGAIIAHLVTR